MNKVFFGDCRDSIRQMIDDGVKVQMCVTSPPYYGLRDYGHDGQLGLEETPTKYVENMVDVFRLVKELLTDDGVLWLNIGDSYSSHKDCKSVGQTIAKGTGREKAHEMDLGKSRVRDTKMLKAEGLKNKDLIGIPWMLAFALRADGWYLRQDIIWSKSNPMPESVKDRCTKSHEYIFLLSKSTKYFYDADAIKEPLKDSSAARLIQDIENQEGSGRVPGKSNGKMKAVRFGGNKYGNDDSYSTGIHSGKEWTPKMAGGGSKVNGATHSGYLDNRGQPLCGVMANKKSVWVIPTKGYKEAHFATFPTELIMPCILAGSRVNDVVLDPFFGSGTTGQVCQQLGRKWIGCEINTDYESLQKDRTAQKGMVFA